MNKFIIVELAKSGRKHSLDLSEVKFIEESTYQVGDEENPCLKIDFKNGEWIKVDEDFEKIFAILNKYHAEGVFYEG